MAENILRFFRRLIPNPVFRFFQPVYHFLLSVSGRVVFGRLAERMFTIGVTGTKGKTTTIALINAILEKAGEETALLSSVYRKTGENTERKKSPNTMPGRWYIPKFLKEAATKGSKYAILEVTSQGVEQFRHKFIDWDMAVFLNIHPEHIEAHGSFKKYRRAKVKFFESLRVSKKNPKYFLINGDDKSSMYFKEAAMKTSKKSRKIIIFSKDDIYKIVEEIREEGKARDWLKADFNLENVAAAVAFAKTRDIQYHIIKKAIIEYEGLPGRLEFVAKKPYSVVVDYAHTPDSLRALYRNLRENYNLADDGRLICVLGSAGGGRDKWKRPEIGKIMASYGDLAILTSEDPYDEDPHQIISEIESGIPKAQIATFKIIKEIDRKKAIERAISKAKPGDVVVITGIGSQSWFYGPRGEKIPWNEAEIAREIFERYNKLGG